MTQCSAEIITSRQNATVVEVHKLSDRKHRQKSGLFRFDGVKLASEAIQNGVFLQTILLRASDAERVRERLLSASCELAKTDARVLLLADSVFDSLSEEQAPEGILCVARMQSDRHRAWRAGDEIPPLGERLILLESVRDPSNLGAIIRSAAALGIDRLIMSTDCADLYSAKTVRASMGTLFSQPIDRTSSLTAYIEALQQAGRRVFAAALDDRAQRLGCFAIQSGDCAVIGNEGHGLSEQTLATCDNTVYIPMTAQAESLNAAVAAALLMWEFGGKQL